MCSFGWWCFFVALLFACCLSGVLNFGSPNYRQRAYILAARVDTCTKSHFAMICNWILTHCPSAHERSTLTDCFSDFGVRLGEKSRDHRHGLCAIRYFIFILYNYIFIFMFFYVDLFVCFSLPTYSVMMWVNSYDSYDPCSTTDRDRVRHRFSVVVSLVHMRQPHFLGETP